MFSVPLGLVSALSIREVILNTFLMIYVPKHNSWLNQVEIWFSVVVRRVLKGGEFASLDDLRQRLLDFIDYLNRTMGKPYRWTYTGQPLTTSPIALDGSHWAE
ncbi:MAG: hypothetical protein ACI92S_003467 [Planctomycetaceae bacterium]